VSTNGDYANPCSGNLVYTIQTTTTGEELSLWLGISLGLTEIPQLYANSLLETQYLAEHDKVNGIRNCN